MLGNKITYYRKKLGITQEQLAQQLDVTNQAVSKWETDQCCPDTLLLPKLADIFGVSIDELFGREAPAPETPAPESSGLPWEDDGAFHIVMYHGHTLIGSQPEGGNLTFTYEGPAKDVYCALNLECGDVSGSVTAEGYVECGDVDGEVKAGGYVDCGDVGGSLASGSYVDCGDVNGSLAAGGYVECGDVGGNVSSAGYVDCGDVGGNVTAASGYVECGDVGGCVNGGGAGGFHFGPFGK